MTDQLIVLNAAALGALIVVQTIALILGLVRMHRDSMRAHGETQALIERLEKYRLVERK